MSSAAKTAKKSKKKKTTPKDRGTFACPGRHVLEDSWPAWQDYFRDRPSPKHIEALVDSGNRAPLLWAAPASFLGTEAAVEIATLTDFAKGTKSIEEMVPIVDDWLSIRDDGNPAFALRTIAWAHALPHLAQFTDYEVWQSILDHLLATATDALGIDLDERPLLSVLLAGELPITLAYQLPELADLEALVNSAFDFISTTITELTDGEGLLGIAHWPIARLLFASLVRIRHLEEETGLTTGLDSAARTQYDWFIRQMIAITRPDGSQIFDHDALPLPKRLYRSALSLDGDKLDRLLAGKLLRGFDVPKSSGQLADPPVYSEWAGVTVSRSRYDRQCHLLATGYDEKRLSLELITKEVVLLSGDVTFQLTANGKSVDLRSKYNEVCWYSDDEVDYLELEAELDFGWTIQRQLLFGKDDQFVYLSDVIIGSDEAEWFYSCDFPLAAGIDFHPARETHEGHLIRDKKLASIIPLSLPEWRCDRPVGELTQISNGMRYEVRGKGRGGCAAMFIDLSSSRITKDLTWRQLTVAHRLEMEPTDRAVGYRIQVGKDQFVIYRSLTDPINRSFLGQNYSCEFLVGRLVKDGTLEELVQIE